MPKGKYEHNRKPCSIKKCEICGAGIPRTRDKKGYLLSPSTYRRKVSCGKTLCRHAVRQRQCGLMRQAQNKAEENFHLEREERGIVRRGKPGRKRRESIFEAWAQRRAR